MSPRGRRIYWIAMAAIFAWVVYLLLQ